MHSIQFRLLMIAFITTGTSPTKWSMPSLEKLSAINFFKELFGYAAAVLANGIPSMDIAPLDPFVYNEQMTIKPNISNPRYSNYTGINITIDGLTVANFSKTLPTLADLNAERMSVTLTLLASTITFYGHNMTATAVRTDNGSDLQYDCPDIYGDFYNSRFDSIFELKSVNDTEFGQLRRRVNRTVLQVDQLDMSFTVPFWDVYLSPVNCTGDDEIIYYILDTFSDEMDDIVNVISTWLDGLSANLTTVFNEILAMRNATKLADCPEDLLKSDDDTDIEIVKVRRHRGDRHNTSLDMFD